MSAITGFRVVKPDMTSRDRFQYPSSGHVECEDFIDDNECGNGLHFWTEDSCDFSSCSYHSPDNLWLIVEAENAINLGGKYKSKSLTVLEVITLSEMVDRFPTVHFPCVFKQAGYGSTLTAGYGSTLTAGDRSTLTARSGSTLTAGDRSTLTARSVSTLTAGDRSTLTAGYGSTLTAGDRSTLTAGYGSTLTAGDGSVLIIFNAYGVPFVKKVTKRSSGKPHVMVNDKIVIKRGS